MKHTDRGSRRWKNRAVFSAADHPEKTMAAEKAKLPRVPKPDASGFARLFTVKPSELSEGEFERLHDAYTSAVRFDSSLFPSSFQRYYPSVFVKPESGEFVPFDSMSAYDRRHSILSIMAGFFNATDKFHGRPLSETYSILGEMESKLEKLKQGHVENKLSPSEDSDYRFASMEYLVGRHVLGRLLLDHWAELNGKTLPTSLKEEIFMLTNTFSDFKCLQKFPKLVAKYERVERQKALAEQRKRGRMLSEVGDSLSKFHLTEEERARLLSSAEKLAASDARDFSQVTSKALSLHNSKLKDFISAKGHPDLWERIHSIKDPNSRSQVIFNVVKALSQGQTPDHALFLVPKVERVAQAALVKASKSEKLVDFSGFLGKFERLADKDRTEFQRVLGKLHKKFGTPFIDFLGQRVNGQEDSSELLEVIESARKDFLSTPDAPEGHAEEHAFSIPTVTVPKRRVSIEELLDRIENARVVAKEDVVGLRKLAVLPNATPYQQLLAAKHLILHGHSEHGFTRKLPNEAAFQDYLPVKLRQFNLAAVKSLISEGKLVPRASVAGRPAWVVSHASLIQKYHGTVRE